MYLDLQQTIFVVVVTLGIFRWSTRYDVSNSVNTTSILLVSQFSHHTEVLGDYLQSLKGDHPPRPQATPARLQSQESPTEVAASSSEALGKSPGLTPGVDNGVKQDPKEPKASMAASPVPSTPYASEKDTEVRTLN